MKIHSLGHYQTINKLSINIDNFGISDFFSLWGPFSLTPISLGRSPDSMACWTGSHLAAPLDLFRKQRIRAYLPSHDQHITTPVSVHASMKKFTSNRDFSKFDPHTLIMFFDDFWSIGIRKDHVIHRYFSKIAIFSSKIMFEFPI